MEKCEECGAINNDFEECTHSSGFISSATSRLSKPFTTRVEDDGFDDFESDGQQASAVWPYLIAPLGAVVFDYVFPIWSTWYVTLGIVVFTYMIVNTVLNLLNSGSKGSFRLFFMSLARSINAPGAIALRSNTGQAARNIALWSAAVIASVIVVFSNVTPANANHLEARLTAEGLELTGQEFEVTCPAGFTSGLPGSAIECRAKVILGLTVPVNVQINGPFEPFTWKAGW
jgi:hypothetical protein